MKKLLLILSFISITSHAKGFTEWTTIESVGQYGSGGIFFTTTSETSKCGNKNMLFYNIADATQENKFYSTLLAALASGKKMRIYLHEPIVCGYLDAQKINIPNFYFISK